MRVKFERVKLFELPEHVAAGVVDAIGKEGPGYLEAGLKRGLEALDAAAVAFVWIERDHAMALAIEHDVVAHYPALGAELASTAAAMTLAAGCPA